MKTYALIRNHDRVNKAEKLGAVDAHREWEEEQQVPVRIMRRHLSASG